ncbi:MAG: D-alanyl-D-alanine carboxypeptidase [Chloroflexi bacterium]|nr:D-alanyl-D-alanine carboxypeptidase [Chloroflexota bacterium]MDA1145242.1 D-alanyl-D-alanine carboxypeptidase [Chloroflexota bacterium]
MRHGARPLLILSLLAVLLSVLPTSALAAATPQPVPAVSRTEAIRTEPLVAGTTAVIRADGSCLRLRDAPDGERLDCFADGSLVTVLEGAEIVGEYRWQRVSIGTQSGWMADEFLEPYTAVTPSCAVSASSTRPGLSGALPARGISIQSWGGGTLSGIVNTALAGGCDLSGIFTVVNGAFVGYRPGSPAFVNQAWFAHFGGEQVPAGTGLLLLCGGPANQATAASSRVPAASAPLTTGLAPTLTTGVPASSVDSAAAIVIDEASGAVLYGNNEHRALAPASLTKIATAILAIEGTDLDAWVTNEVDSRRMIGSSVMGLQPGDCFQVRDLLHGLMLRSGNDAALAIARFEAGSDAAFVNQMNTLLTRLGLTDSNFANPHGLDAVGHVSSAYDLAMLARYGMQIPEFRSTVSSSVWTANGSRRMTMYNINGFLNSYKDADGVKTGFTDDAGRTFVGSAMRDGHRLYVVLLNSSDRYGQAAELLDWSFDNHSWN